MVRNDVDGSLMPNVFPFGRLALTIEEVTRYWRMLMGTPSMVAHARVRSQRRRCSVPHSPLVCGLNADSRMPQMHESPALAGLLVGRRDSNWDL